MSDAGLRQATDEIWRGWRQQARTDLVFLCNTVLGYPDVSEKIHGGIINVLQKFKGGTDTYPIKKDGSHYAPFVPEIRDLDGTRNNLILFPRDCLKSTVANISHSIQWIINYPNIRIVLNTAIADQAEAFIGAIEGHFRYNDTFRWLFPEFAPQGNVKEWGNMSEFTVPCRSGADKEPTMKIATVGSVVSSGHFDVHKYDDMVDKENVRTRDQIEVVNKHFGMMLPLVQTFQVNKMNPEIYEKYGNNGWRDVIGTRYDFGDLYGTILKEEESRKTDTDAAIEKAKAQAKASELDAEQTELLIKHFTKDLKPSTWHVYIQSALKKGTSARDPEAEAFWPERLPLRRLIDIEDDPFNGPEVASSQYYLSPIPPKSGLVDSADQIKFIPRSVINAILPSLRLHCTVDLHGMENNATNDYTVLNLAGFGRDGRPYVVNIWRARYGPEEVIDLIFKIHAEYPRCMDFKIQKDHFMRVLAPYIERERIRRQKFPNIIAVPINNQMSKQQKIKGLRPWLRNGDLKFPDDLACKQDVIYEVMYFPKYPHDDILDTLADHLQNADGEVNCDVMPTPRFDPSTERVPGRLFNKFIGFGQDGRPEFFDDDSVAAKSMTGVL